ncbi:MAG TPA: amidohydrolase family protein [Sphingomonadaceae bacterium]|nr:amidohydrolase family protein [Sphingomonadaceae bacterium]
MIIDCHGHVSAPVELWAYKAGLLAHRGSHGRGGVRVTDEQIIEAAHRKEAFPKGHIPLLHDHGTDLQLISPRPFQMMNSMKPARVVHWFCEEVNTIIHRQCQLIPDTFIPVGGLPQAAGEPIEETFGEIDRLVSLGFKGVLLNPDPYENSGTQAPAMGDRYWYPLYEKLCELDMPAHIHATGSVQDREPYSLHFINEETTAVYGLCNSDVFDDFPSLKIVVSHGGGAMPYQFGRFEANSLRRKHRFSERMRHLYFDTVLYTEGAIRLLIETVGADRCLFGSECPGVGSAIVPETGKQLDDIAPIIKNADWLTEDEKTAIFEGNARKVFNLDV